jgi:hypothetical protein
LSGSRKAPASPRSAVVDPALWEADFRFPFDGWGKALPKGKPRRIEEATPG